MAQPEYWSRDQNSTNSVRPHVKEDPEGRLGAADRDAGAGYCLRYRQHYLETISQVKADISPRSPDPTAVIRASKGILLEVPRNCTFHSIIAVSRQLEATGTRDPAVFAGGEQRFYGSSWVNAAKRRRRC